MSVLEKAIKSRQYSDDLTWQDWKRLAATTEHLPILLGLVHDAYNAYARDSEERKDRHLLLLALADREEKYSPTKLELKAFQTLALNLFKESLFDSDSNTRLDVDVVRGVIHFFRPLNPVRADHGNGLKNLTFPPELRSAAEQADKFLTELCLAIWKGKYDESLRPNVIQILCARKMLHKLSLGDNSRSLHDYVWKCFDEPSVQELERIVLANYSTIEEGILNRFEAAQTLLIVRSGLKEYARVKEEERIRKEIGERERDLERLRNK